MGKLNDDHTKQAYVALKTKRKKWGKCVNTENGGKSSKTAQHKTTKGQMQKRGHPAHSSMSASMSSTGCEQLAWELLGSAAERVTRSVSGTNLGGSSCMVKITPNAPNLDHAKK